LRLFNAFECHGLMSASRVYQRLSFRKNTGIYSD
jgi:hypothetical protein